MRCLVIHLSAGVEYWRDHIIDAFIELINPVLIYERSDNDARIIEGLPIRKGIIRGTMTESSIMIEENNLKYLVDIQNGQKTGHYLDQRKNRYLLRQYTYQKDVLDCFSYTGGFMINALVGGAKSVTCLESSADAIGIARENLTLNNLSSSEIEFIQGDVFHILRKYRDQAKSFNVIILDPPKFAQKSSQVHKAARAYKDINLLAFKLLSSDGLLFTFSCSGGISDDLFQKIIFGAALDAGVNARIIARLHQDFDHPVDLNFPEGAYLKGLVLQVGD
jgi:23S rRNA (cytosine1962-C5)-methyltransferase